MCYLAYSALRRGNELTTDSKEEDQKSRSQMKREFKEVKQLVQQLVELSPNRLQGASLSESIRDAVLAARDMERYPLKRQIGFIAGQLQEDDIASIRTILSGEPHPEPDPEQTDVPESQRRGNELITGDDQTLGLFIDEHPGVDLQHLRQLVRNAKKERKRKKPGKSTRQLFEYLERLNREAG